MLSELLCGDDLAMMRESFEGRQNKIIRLIIIS